MSKYEDMTDGYDEFSAVLQARRCVDYSNEGIEKVFYVKTVDSKVTKYSKVAENCAFYKGKFWRVKDGKIVEGAPSYIEGDFDCSGLGVISLEGSPNQVGGTFDCTGTKITSLKGAPREVGSFYCSYTDITSLEGCPHDVKGNFFCGNTKITSLKGAPSSVYGIFDCSNTKITSLEGAPMSVRSFLCRNTGVPRKQIDAYMDFIDNPKPELSDGAGHYRPMK